MLNKFKKDERPFHQRGSEYHYKTLKLNYQDYEFYRDVSNLRVSTEMGEYAKQVAPFDVKNNHYLFGIKVCPENSLRPPARDYDSVYLPHLSVPTNLVKHIGTSFFPEAFKSSSDRTRKNAKSPRIFSQSKNYIQAEWKKYITLMRQLAEEDFELIFVSQNITDKSKDRTVPDGEQLYQHLQNRNQTHYYASGVQALGKVATESGVLNDLTLRTKTMIDQSLPSLEKLDDILSAILKLEKQDIETRAQAMVDEALQAYEAKQGAKLQEAEDRQAKKLIEMHETINKLQDMIDSTYKQNELLLKLQESQAGKYEGNLMNLLGKLKDEL